jgi:hypothetical protein
VKGNEADGLEITSELLHVVVFKVHPRLCLYNGETDRIRTGYLPQTVRVFILQLLLFVKFNLRSSEHDLENLLSYFVL